MKTIFVKRNDVYCEQFRLKTEILLDKDRKYVVKKPLSPAAKEHILNMYYGIDKLNLYYTNLEVCKGMLKENELWFDFIEGEPLTKKFIEARQKGKASDFFYWLDYYIKLIQGNHKNQCRFYYTEDFIDYFGNVLGLEETPALKFTPFDITSNNIIIRENNVPVLIDYEWCLDFPMPKDFVIYRCIINLYKLHPDFEQFVTFDKVVDYLNFDINKDLLKKTLGLFL